MSVTAIPIATDRPLHLPYGSNTESKMRLLIANNCEEQVVKLRALFESKFSVQVVRDGGVALCMVRQDQADLLLIDTSVSTKSAISVSKSIKADPLVHEVPVMITSQIASREEEEQALLSGAINYFASDISLNVILSRVEEHLAFVQKQKELELLSCTDGLTGLANKTQLNTVFNSEWHAAKRRNHSIGVIIADIDHFKIYNDTFGHIQGDKCLKQVAQAFAASKKRDEDVAARFGGEEFVMVLPFTDLSGAQEVADRLLDNIRQLEITQSDRANSSIVTVSVGVAAFSPSHKSEYHTGPEDLLAKADANLYKAKKTGRNRWC